MKPSKILLALQFYHGDVDAAMNVARLLADLEPEHSERADLLFSARYDSKPDPATLMYCARKFNVLTQRSRRQATGWPHGPNELWFDTIDQICENTKCGRYRPYRAVLTFESDTTVMSKDWLAGLHRVWDVKPSDKHILGALLGAPKEHINGNALFDGDPAFLAKIRKIGGCNPNEGWDYACRGKFKALGWLGIDQIVSYWQYRTLPEHEYLILRDRGVMFFHGVKDGTGVAWARKHLIGQTRSGAPVRLPLSPPAIVS